MKLDTGSAIRIPSVPRWKIEGRIMISGITMINFAEDREKHCILRFSKANKNRLACKLESHHEKAEEINTHGRYSRIYQVTVAVKNTDKETRECMDDKPHSKGI